MSPDKRFNFANEVVFSGKKIIKTNQNCSQWFKYTQYFFILRTSNIDSVNYTRFPQSAQIRLHTKLPCLSNSESAEKSYSELIQKKVQSLLRFQLKLRTFLVSSPNILLLLESSMRIGAWTAREFGSSSDSAENHIRCGSENCPEFDYIYNFSWNNLL